MALVGHPRKSITVDMEISELSLFTQGKYNCVLCALQASCTTDRADRDTHDR
jgi:hypothetical protein